MQCWAESLNECAGGMTKEHFVSKCLATDPDGVMEIRGLSFCISEHQRIPWKSASSNSLCKKHNNILSSVDQEALRFKRLIETIEEIEPPVKDLGVLKEPQHEQIKGLRLARWIVKTYCNQLAMDRRGIPQPFVDFVFRQTSEPKVRVFLASELDVPFKATPGFYEFMELIHEAGEPTLLANFCGYRWIISTLHLNLPEEPIHLDIQMSLPDNSKATVIRINFNWWPDNSSDRPEQSQSFRK